MGKSSRFKSVPGGKSVGDPLNSSCTIAEAVQISRAAAEDVVQDYHRSVVPSQLANAIHVDVLKSMLIESGLISEGEFKRRYYKKAKEVQESNTPKMEETPDMQMSDTDIEIKKEN